MTTIARRQEEQQLGVGGPLGPVEEARLHRQHQVAPQALVVGDEAVVDEQPAPDAARALSGLRELTALTFDLRAPAPG